MSDWQYVKLGDACTIERGGSPRPIDKYITNDGSGINWIKIGDTTDSMYITHTEQKIIPEGMKKSRYVQPGDFLLSNSMSFGRPYILKIDGCIHDGWLVLRDRENKFDKKFLYYYLSAPSTYRKFKNMAVGGVVNNLNSEMVRGVYVPIPSLEEQSKIASVIENVDAIIEKRKKQLQKLDELIKARFVEMFGDMEFKRLTFKDSTLFIDYRGKTPVVTDKGSIRMVNAKSVGKGVFKYVDEFVTEEVYNEWMHRGLGKSGDILFVTEGHTFGNTCLVPDALEKFALGQRVITIRGQEDLLYNEYLCHYMQTDRFLKDINVYKTGGTAQGIRSKDLAKILIPVPAIELQREFSAFVRRIDKSKLNVQKSLKKLETLKKALMQKYFG